MPKPSLTIQTAMPSIAPNNKDHLVLLTVHHPKQPALTTVRQKLNIAFAIDVSGSMSGCLQGVWKEVPVAPLETALHRGGLQPHPRPVFIGSPYIGTPHIGTPHVGTPMQPWDHTWLLISRAKSNPISPGFNEPSVSITKSKASLGIIARAASSNATVNTGRSFSMMVSPAAMEWPPNFLISPGFCL